MKFAEERERRRDGRSFSFVYEEEDKEGVVRLKMREARVVTKADFAIADTPPDSEWSARRSTQCPGLRVAVESAMVNY